MAELGRWVYKKGRWVVFGADPDRIGLLKTPSRAAFVPLQEPAAVLASNIITVAVQYQLPYSRPPN